MSVNVFADDHSDNSELVEKAKKITEEIASKNQIDEDEVPLNDPFAGNEGMSSSTVNPETGEPLLQVGIAYKHLKDKMAKDAASKDDAEEKEKQNKNPT